MLCKGDVAVVVAVRLRYVTRASRTHWLLLLLPLKSRTEEKERERGDRGGEVPLRRHAKRRVRRDDDRRRARIADGSSETRRRRPTGASMELKILLWAHIVGKFRRRCDTHDAFHTAHITPCASFYVHTLVHVDARNRVTRRMILLIAASVNNARYRRRHAYTPRHSAPDASVSRESRVFPLCNPAGCLLCTFIAPIDGIRYRSILATVSVGRVPKTVVLDDYRVALIGRA